MLIVDRLPNGDEQPDLHKADVIRIPIEPHFAGDYRLEYDGKYITLFGRDRNYAGFKFNEDDEDIISLEKHLTDCNIKFTKGQRNRKYLTVYV